MAAYNRMGIAEREMPGQHYLSGRAVRGRFTGKGVDAIGQYFSIRFAIQVDIQVSCGPEQPAGDRVGWFAKWPRCNDFHILQKGCEESCGWASAHADIYYVKLHKQFSQAVATPAAVISRIEMKRMTEGHNHVQVASWFEDAQHFFYADVSILHMLQHGVAFNAADGVVREWKSLYGSHDVHSWHIDEVEIHKSRSNPLSRSSDPKPNSFAERQERFPGVLDDRQRWLQPAVDPLIT